MRKLKLKAKQREALIILFETEAPRHCKDCEGCCCSGCARNEAYLPTDKFERAKQCAVWDEQKGFLTAEGCALPRKKRSDVCLSFYCGRFSPAFECLVKEILEPGLYDRIQEYERKARHNRRESLKTLITQVRRDNLQARLESLTSYEKGV